MIVKILSSSRTFKGVNYNTKKIDANKGELAKVANFGPLQAMQRLRPEDYVRYLKMVSGLNKNVKLPQFHVAISTKGRKHDKEALTEIAEKWLLKMGYSKQPYLIIFHKDTRNNHVHIVSTRVDRDGQKISSAYEKNRAIYCLNSVMGINEELVAKMDFQKALEYNFTTKAQFSMILEGLNYTVSSDKESFSLIKYGKVVGQFDPKLITSNQAHRKQKLPLSGKAVAKANRGKQLVAIFNRYASIHSTRLFHNTRALAGGREKLLSNYSCDFAEFLRQKFGVELIFHSENNLSPYGYSIIDHNDQIVFKGSEVMDLQVLLEKKLATDAEDSITMNSTRTDLLTEPKADDSDISISFDTNKLANQEKSVSVGKIQKDDAGFEIENDEEPIQNLYTSEQPQKLEFKEDQDNPDPLNLNFELAEDIDDEAILGRNRRRQKKARTNTR